MVRALLAGQKTQTRRLAWQQPQWFQTGDDKPEPLMVPSLWQRVQPGDLLYVRETWAVDAELDEARRAHEDALPGGLSYGPYYRATEVAPETLKWRVSIHMPRWASRLTLEITDVRVQRVQEISESDAIAEGFPAIDRDKPTSTARDQFCGIWHRINGPESWVRNDWVWAVSFKGLAL